MRALSVKERFREANDALQLALSTLSPLALEAQAAGSDALAALAGDVAAIAQRQVEADGAAGRLEAAMESVRGLLTDQQAAAFPAAGQSQALAAAAERAAAADRTAAAAEERAAAMQRTADAGRSANATASVAATAAARDAAAAAAGARAAAEAAARVAADAQAALAKAAAAAGDRDAALRASVGAALRELAAGHQLSSDAALREFREGLDGLRRETASATANAVAAVLAAAEKQTTELRTSLAALQTTKHADAVVRVKACSPPPASSPCRHLLLSAHSLQTLTFSQAGGLHDHLSAVQQDVRALAAEVAARQEAAAKAAAAQPAYGGGGGYGGGGINISVCPNISPNITTNVVTGGGYGGGYGAAAPGLLPGMPAWMAPPAAWAQGGAPAPPPPWGAHQAQPQQPGAPQQPAWSVPPPGGWGRPSG